ncbi:AlpA family phage regulatory protein [Labrys neptuniae]|uniref:helix-turn-helix transcriptional regulator n=1 Tax=Labrys neptuniae TaxID=376174 RepID=UPI002891D6F5|nr:AlpA family phage regulatory protein [Labrys neptuniae]MDT3377420.1 AlpA family phage regulatory protein [Labrys neptuniae]
MATATTQVYLSDRQVGQRYNVHKATIWTWLKANPTFPRPVSLSQGCTRWRLSDLEVWEAAKAARAA